MRGSFTVVPDADYRIKLPVFEGPLDLLLFLIRKSEIDIYDIPIEAVTRQYLDILRSMQQLDLEIAGEFFVMAATLMEIKSRMLLPRGQHAIDPNAEDDDAMDPRWELVHQLLQYKKFKEASRELDQLATFQIDMLPRLVPEVTLQENERPLKSVDRIEVWNSFNIVLRRLAEKLVVGEIQDEQVTVSDRMEWLLERIKTEKSFTFTSLFPGKITLRVLVASFIAVLELTRLKKLRVSQDEAYGDINITAVDETLPEFTLASAAAPELAAAETTPAAAEPAAATPAAENALETSPASTNPPSREQEAS